MGNFIAVHLLKHYNPGTFNRGEDGEAKQITVGGVNRVRFSSQCQKRAIREIMACEEIRTTQIEKLIASCLDVKVADKTITEEEKDIIGSLICSKEVIGVDPNQWEALMGRYDKKINRVVVTTNASEIDALINSFIDYLKENGKDALKKDYKKVAETAALSDVNLSVAKSLFGTMATDGVLGTVDGALQIGQAYSVDAYLPESDFFTVKFVGRSGADSSDPFFGAYDDFNTTESAKASGETINQGLSLYSNLMYSYANINLKELERNLNTYVYPRVYSPNKDTKETLINTVVDFTKAMIAMVPEATQNRSASCVEPTAVLIEVIKDGSNLQPDWSKAISAQTNKTISEQAIEKLSKFANNKTFRSGDIQQFVMFGSEFEDSAKLFTDAKQIKSFAELEKILKKTITPLI